MIRAGLHLEELIADNTHHAVHAPSKRCKSLKYADLQLNTLTQKTLVSKLKFKDEQDLKNTDLDFAVIDPDLKSITIIEMKDGDNFDTKKSAEETAKLFRLTDWLGARHPDWMVSPRIVFWNNEDLKKSSFKDKSAQKIKMNGHAAQGLLGVNCGQINSLRRLSLADNDVYLLERMASIVDKARQRGEIL